MSNPMRWGILSTGNIANQFAAGVASGGEASVIAAVASRDAGKAKAFAAKHRISQSFGDYQALLDDDAIEAVYIGLPNHMHHEWTLKALAAGKHVLCEKPLASNHAQAIEMFDAATKANRLLVEAFMYRAHPLTQAVKAKLDSGAIGELKVVRTSFCFKLNNPDTNVRFSTDMAGGGIMDIGCYCLDFGRFMTGGQTIASVDVVGNLHSSGVDDLAAGTVVFDNGVINSFVCGMSLQSSNWAMLCGTEGYIEVPVPWKPLPPLAEFSVARMTPPRMELSQGRSMPSGAMRETFGVRVMKPLYALEADAFVAAARGEAEPAIDAAASIENMKWLDAMRKKVGVPV